MATQLAVLFLRRLRVPVVISDLDQARVDRAVAGIHAEIDTLAGARAGSSPDEANRLHALISGTVWDPSGDLAAYADCDLVIEAVFEELEVKRQVFAELERHVGPETVLATNTSSLSVAAMADGARAPGAGGRLPLLQPRRGAARWSRSSGRPQHRRRHRRHGAGAREDAEEERGPRRRRARVRGQPGAAAVHGRGDGGGRRGHAGRGGRRRAGAAGAADVDVHAAAAGRSGRRAARGRDPARRAGRPRSSCHRTCAALVAAGRPGLYDWRPDGTPYVSDETAGAADRRGPRRAPPSRCASGC